ncbi:MAG: helix-turn-helix transcriptional regulator [Gammaproteobacteria bacterium]|nr:helix-turn-helix transcriptional regulator [Gammaproteobacteria bacterium]MBT7371952.1 helix-turn-helix transcriptional regulator [Gammaproteobacteria bacterium]
MKLKSFKGMNCSLAQTLNIVGERWSLLIIRDISFGTTHFDEIQKSLGVARNMLSTRLKQLTEAGILRKEADDAGRSQYKLTDKGWDLMPVLLSMTHWGDKHVPDEAGDRVVFVDQKTGRPIQPMGIHDADGSRINYYDIKPEFGPALRR